MVDITKLDMTDIWASGGDKIAPSPEKIAQGWLVEAVPRQTWNWFENRQDQNIAYLLQKGIPEWDATTEYLINKTYVQCNGVVYKCIATNTNNDPATATAYWSKAFVDSTAYLEKIKDLAVVNNTTSVINGSGVATNVPYGSVGLSLLAASTQAAGRTAIGAQQLNTHLTALAGLTSATNLLPYFNGVGTMATTAITAFGRALLDDADAAAGRATLDVPSNSDFTTRLAGKQPLDATLTALAGVTTAANQLIYSTGSDTFATTSLTGFGRSLLDDVDAAAGRTTLGLSGQSLLALNALSGASDTLPWFDSVSTMQTTPLTAMGRSLVGAADAAAVRKLLSLLKTSSTSDATKGALLQCWDFGVGGWAVSLPSNDFNLPGGSGFWQNDNSVAYLNGPPQVANTTPFVMTQVTYAATSKVQTAVSVNTNRAFRRTQLSGVWSDWQDINPQSYGLGSSTPPLIADFNDVYPPGFYRAYGALNAQATPGAPTDSANTALTVLAMRGLSSHDFTTYLVTTAQATVPSVWIGGRVSGGAFQWRRIDPQAFGWGTLQAPALADLDATATESGLYRVTTGAVGTLPSGATPYGTILVERWGDTHLKQTFTPNGNTALAGNVYTRVYSSGWKAWVKNYSTGNLLGTVSQSAGVPTGAVIERGSNANGSYVKFADGTLICQMQVSTSSFSASGSVYVSNTVIFTFPATFITAGDVSVLGSDTVSSGMLVSGLANTASEGRVQGTFPIPVGQPVRTFRLTAIGRWF